MATPYNQASTGNRGWSGDVARVWYHDGPTKQVAGTVESQKVDRWLALLEKLATTPHLGSGAPGVNNDLEDTANAGRPFRAGALWTDSTTGLLWYLHDHSEGAADWRLFAGITNESSSSSSSSSQSSSSSSSPSSSNSSSSSSSNSSSSSSSESSSTLAETTSVSSSSSSNSSSSSSNSSSSSSNSSSSSTVAGNTSSSSSSTSFG